MDSKYDNQISDWDNFRNMVDEYAEADDWLGFRDDLWSAISQTRKETLLQAAQKLEDREVYSGWEPAAVDWLREQAKND